MTDDEYDRLCNSIKRYDGFPNTIEKDEILGCQLLREVPDDFYALMDKGIDIVAYKDRIYYPQKRVSAVLTLSVNLYGYYSVEHIKIRERQKNKTYYPLFLDCDYLSKVKYKIALKNDNVLECVVSYGHEPNCENYWHFEIFLLDAESNERITDATKPQSKPKEAAKRLLSYIIPKAICPLENKKKYFNSSVTEILKNNGVYIA